MKMPHLISTLIDRLRARLGFHRAARSVEPPPLPAIDDRVREDHGRSTSDRHISQSNMEKVKRNAALYSKDEPGS